MKPGELEHKCKRTYQVLGRDRTVLNEESFHAMISLERKRTERSQRPFLLMLLDIRPAAHRRQEREKVGGNSIRAFRSTSGKLISVAGTRTIP